LSTSTNEAVDKTRRSYGTNDVTHTLSCAQDGPTFRAGIPENLSEEDEQVGVAGRGR